MRSLVLLSLFCTTVPALAQIYRWTADPFTTTITLVGGRVSEIERVRNF